MKNASLNDKINYNAIAACGGQAKPTSPLKSSKSGLKRQNHPLKRKTKLKNKFKPIPIEVKKAVLQEKGDRCFMGFCERCHGTRVMIHEGQHHFPHKGPYCTPDDVKYLWPAHDLCQGWYHEHPKEERELFKRLEAAGHRVYWSIPIKSGG